MIAFNAMLSKTLKCSVMAVMSVTLFACSSLPDFDMLGEDGVRENELSQIDREKRARLLAGQSSRPSLASLNLLPQGRDTDDSQTDDAALPEAVASDEDLPEIPSLSLEKKKAEYEALLPLISDPVQRQQAAFRLADINMLLAERALEEGMVAQTGVKADTQHPFTPAIESYIEVLNQHEVLIPNPEDPLSEEQQALNRKQMDAMYQLSRALDLSGQKSQSVEVAKQYLEVYDLNVFGISEQHIELFFRIGEYYFNRNQYAAASEYYAQVVTNYQLADLQNSQNFYSISSYMLGWSEFKQDKYDAALAAFDLMLSDTFAEASPSDLLRLDEIDFLSTGEMRLVRDSMRIMALTFSYQGSGAAIAKFYDQRNALQNVSSPRKSHYKHLIFEELAQQYLDEDRFNESANALLVFAQNNPLHPRAVEFYVRHIDAYILGDFPEKVLLAKRRFVDTYSLGGEVLKRLDSPVGEAAQPYLKQYLVELAQTEHSIAQGIDSILQARAANALESSSSSTSNSNEALGTANQGFVSEGLSQQMRNTLTNASTMDLETLRLEGYEQAIAYYENYIRTFSYAGGRTDEKVPELRFYLAEANMSLARYEQAIQAFETYAYQDSPNPLAVEAAYAAILAYDKLASDDTAVLVRSLAQQSQERFVLSFSQDRRAPVVALNLMQTLFNNTDYVNAQRWATWFLQEAPSLHSLSFETMRSANLVMAHSEFALEQYASAESYYRLLLSDAFVDATSTQNTTLPGDEAQLNESSSRDNLIDRLAATLYRQAEQELMVISLTPAELAQQENAYDIPLNEIQRELVIKAIGFWQAIVSDTPSSTFRMAAQYDSASYYALLGQWDNAISTWSDFAQRYPQDPLTAGIDGNLLYAYQQTEDWEAAAQLLVAQWNADKQSDTSREALYQAATYYDRADNRAMAIDTFRTYAHGYPEPLELANEARFQLSEYYLESGEDAKRRFWLSKLVDAQVELAQGATSPASVGTPRSRYLASLAAMVFANDADVVFSRIKLTLPLNESLSQKQAALSDAISAYDQVMSFAVADFTSEANYKLANLYMQLAQDLMDSSRPTELSALELSQYDILLEEQAYPFEEKAIELHENNVARVLSGLYDTFVKRSFSALAATLPARYNKQEMNSEVNADDL